MSAALEVTDLRKDFGGNRAVDGCSFSIDAGRITGLIGPNGAGKSTVFNLIGGQLRPDGGRIAWDDRQLVGCRPDQIARLGIGRTFQIPREFGALTVIENLMAVPGRQFGERMRSLLTTGRRVAEEEVHLRERALAVLEYVELADQADSPAGGLSGGQKKLLELARCLMGQPRLVLLDEPTAGVNPRLIGDLVGVLRRLKEDGITLAIVEHNMNVVMGLCDRIIVLDGGRTLMTGTPDEVRNDPRVLEAYLGGAAHA